jgi:hypothetical protein
MKYIIRLAVTLGLGAFTSLAQQQAGGRGGPPGGPHGMGRPPVPPVMKVLDADRDGELSAAEIANASNALLTLDKDGDGKLSTTELMPPPPGGTNQFGLRPPAGAKPPVPLVIAALDPNEDGELDATEIANASASLLQLDVNADGKLSRDELRPPRPSGPGGQGGPGGPGGPDGAGAPDNSGPPPEQ